MKKIIHFSPLFVPLANLLTWSSILARYVFFDGEYAQLGRTFAIFYVIISVVHIVFSFFLYFIVRPNPQTTSHVSLKNARNAFFVNFINTFIVLILIIFQKFHILIFSALIGIFFSFLSYNYLKNVIRTVNKKE